MTVAKRGIMTGLSAAMLAAGYSAISLASLENSDMLEIGKVHHPKRTWYPQMFLDSKPRKSALLLFRQNI